MTVFDYARPPLQISIPHASALIQTAEWIDPKFPFRGTEFVLPKKKLGWVIHYPGTSNLGRYLNDPVAWARAIQIDYLGSRGYSGGYNYIVGRLGEILVMRGRYRSAANGTNDSNESYLAVQVMVDDEHGITDAQVLAIQRLIQDSQDRDGYGSTIVGHQTIKSTSCPGAEIEAMVVAGRFQPLPASWPENIVVPPPKPIPPTPAPPTPLPPPTNPLPGADVKNLEVIQFQFGPQVSGVFLVDGMDVAWIYTVHEGGETYNIAKDWLDFLGQTTPKLVPSSLARQMRLVGPRPIDTPGFLTVDQLKFRVD